MAISLDHTIVPVEDQEKSAQFYSSIFGFEDAGTLGHFRQIRAGGNLTLDLDKRDIQESHHYAFRVSDEEFDRVYGKVKEAGILYGSGPRSHEDMEVGYRREERHLYFQDPNGHLLEILTRNHG